MATTTMIEPCSVSSASSSRVAGVVQARRAREPAGIGALFAMHGERSVISSPTGAPAMRRSRRAPKLHCTSTPIV